MSVQVHEDNLTKPYLIRQLTELNEAHKSNILIYSREKFSNQLAKKLRPEFSHIYISSEPRDCIHIIQKLNIHPDSDGINAVILDSDFNSIKVIEYIRNRSINPKYKSYPLISTIVLYSLHDDFDLKSHSISNYVSSFIILPTSYKEVFKVIIDVIHKSYSVDDVYRDLKQTHQNAKSFPFLPIFETAADDADDENDEKANEQDDKDDDDDLAASSGISDMEVDDWTDSSSLLPSLIKEVRQVEKNKLGIEEDNSKSKDELLVDEMYDRTRIDKSLLKQIHSNTIKNGSRHSSFKQLDDDSTIGGESVGEVARDVQVSDSNINTNKQLNLSKPVKRHGSNLRAARLSKVNLIDIRRRPKWNVKSSDKHNDNDIDMTLYIDKKPPDLSIKRTVGGLNKKQCDKSWSIIKAYGDIEKINFSSSKISNSIISNASPPISPIKKSHDGSEISSSFSFDEKLNNKYNFNNNKNNNVVIAEAISADDEDQNENLDVYRDAIKTAEKNLRKMARETPPDIQIHNVIDVDLSNRKVTLWERDLIEQARFAEKEGYFEHAMSSYTRSGTNSKEPHLSKIFLGSFYFRTNKYMTALECFSDALRMINSLKASSMYNKEDEFVARFNRGVTYFRLGNDETGLEDLETALKLNPNHIKALEVYAIVLRRIGRYDEAILAKSNALNVQSNTSEGLGILSQFDENNNQFFTSNKSPNSKKHVRLSPFRKGRRNSHLSSSSLDKFNMTHSIDRQNSNRSINSSRTSRSSRSGGEESPKAKPEVNNCIVINIEDPKVGYSLAQRKKELQQSLEKNDGDSAQVESLTAFKVLNGFKQTLFETLFVKPTALQEALLVIPNKRMLSDIEIIGTNLKLIPAFKTLSKGTIAEMSSKIEYRTVPARVDIFLQNLPCDYVCIILKGIVQMRMDNPLKVSQSIPLGELVEGDIFGHIDLLFQQSDTSQFLKELKQYISQNATTYELESPILLQPMQSTNAIVSGDVSVNNSEQGTPSGIPTHTPGRHILPLIPLPSLQNELYKNSKLSKLFINTNNNSNPSSTVSSNKPTSPSKSLTFINKRETPVLNNYQPNNRSTIRTNIRDKFDAIPASLSNPLSKRIPPNQLGPLNLQVIDTQNNQSLNPYNRALSSG